MSSRRPSSARIPPHRGGSSLRASIPDFVPNFAAGSLDSRRELAIEIHDDHIVERLHGIAHDDWKHAHAFDLSDAGLSVDLEARVDGSSELLALEPDRRLRL
jgi:hypothetical protein